MQVTTDKHVKEKTQCPVAVMLGLSFLVIIHLGIWPQ
jgi:hypothetical protein